MFRSDSLLLTCGKCLDGYELVTDQYNYTTCKQNNTDNLNCTEIQYLQYNYDTSKYECLVCPETCIGCIYSTDNYQIECSACIDNFTLDSYHQCQPENYTTFSSNCSAN